MAGAPADPRIELARLATALDAAAERLTADPRPPASVLDGFAASIRQAHAVLAECDGTLPEADPADRLAALRLAIGVRGKLMIVARLVAGSAWYAALVRELDGDERMKQGGTYGRQGAAPPMASSIERRA